MNDEQSGGIRVERTVTIDKPAEELYRFWKDFGNLSCFFDHLESVSVIDEKISHWAAKAPAGIKLEWNSEIFNDIENELLQWRSVEGSEMTNSGMVQFTKAPGDRGTEVKVVLRYDPPGGAIGAAFAKLFGEDPSRELREGLRRLKEIMETGEISTVQGQPSGRSA